MHGYAMFTHTQSIRLSFSDVVPPGDLRRRNMKTNTAAIAESGRFISICWNVKKRKHTVDARKTYRITIATGCWWPVHHR